MSRTLTWIAAAVSLAVPLTLIVYKLNSQRKKNVLNKRYDTDDILFDV